MIKRIMATLLTLALVGAFTVGVQNASAQTTLRHHLFSELLSTYVHNGMVNYNTMRSDKRLAGYISWLAKTDPDTLPNKKEKLAFWINAYNAYTLKIVCDNYPVERINELHTGELVIGTPLKSTVWDKKFVIVNGRAMTLNTIEHEIVRLRFKDERAHFALVCASKSCPSLRADAYEGSTLDEQLDDQGRHFLTDPFRNEFDPVKKRAEISRIFSWFAADFGSSDERVLRFIAPFLPDSLSQQILANTEEWDIDYKPYDWTLNGY